MNLGNASWIRLNGSDNIVESGNFELFENSKPCIMKRSNPIEFDFSKDSTIFDDIPGNDDGECKITLEYNSNYDDDGDRDQ